MSLPVFIPTAEVSLELPAGKRFTLAELCHQANVVCRVSGPPAERLIKLGHSKALRAVRKPGPLSEVWVGVPSLRSPVDRAFKALGVLAYGVFDYGARESLRGLDRARPTVGPGRPWTGRAMTAAERQRKRRARLAKEKGR